MVIFFLPIVFSLHLYLRLGPNYGCSIREYCYTGNVFVEPCCGGASVSLYLLEHKVVSSVILADKDPWVASFWKMLFCRTDELLNDIENVEVNVQQWKDFRAKAPQTTREKALYCFF